MGLSRNKVAVSEGAAGSPPFYGETQVARLRGLSIKRPDIKIEKNPKRMVERNCRESFCCSILKDCLKRESPKRLLPPIVYVNVQGARYSCSQVVMFI